MSVITWPAFAVRSFKWFKVDQAEIFRSPFGSQSIETGVPMLEVSMMGVSASRSDARIIQVFLESLNGYQNQLALWNVEHPQPAGTMRGSMTLNTSAGQGASSIQIFAAGEAGKTLQAGDLIGIGSTTTQQVMRITTDATTDAYGYITVSLGTPLRNAFSSGQAITWDKPKALFRQKSLNDGIQFSPDGGEPWSLSLREDWRP